MQSPLVDFHCHLDLFPNHPSAVERCERDGIFTLAVTTTPRAWPRNHELASATRYVRAALGLHPQLVADRAHEIELFEQLLPRTRYVGEVGLDASPRFYKSFDKQKQIFERVLSLCASAGNKIITTHSVRSTKTVLDMVEQHMPPNRGRLVLHWFTGTKSEAKRAVDLGCYFSVNAAMLANEKRASITKAIPLERILTETDGPFTTTYSRPTTPSDVWIAVEGLSRLHGMLPDSMANIVMRNLKRLLVEQD